MPAPPRPVRPTAVDTLVTRGILTPGTGKHRRSEIFQADDVLRLIDEAS
jgi:hypothetical protein